MLLFISTALAIIYAFLNPFSEGLYLTSLWVAQIMIPSDSDEIVDTKMTKQLLKFNQAALLDGWPSNIPLINSILPIICTILGFFYSWWGGILMYIVAIFLGATTKFFLTRPATYYLSLLSHRMANRIADYKIKNDNARAEAAEEVSTKLYEIIVAYGHSLLKPPSTKEIKNNPYGDVYFWLNSNSH